MPRNEKPIVIEARNISFSQGNDEILTDFSFNIHAGDYVAVIGPNGGGKSTLLKIMLGLLSPSSGEMSIFTTSIARARKTHRLGYVPQHGGLLELTFPATVEEVVGSTRAMKDLDIVKLRNKPLSQLSGGQRQRALLARALANDPEILFLDEPTDGLDAQSQQLFHEAIHHRNEKKGMTVIYVTHDVHSIAKETNTALCIKHHLVCHGHNDACVIRGTQLHNPYHASRQEIEGHHDVSYV